MTETTFTTPETDSLVRRFDLDLWVRRASALLVAAVAAYGSYQHQRTFALHAGADPTSAQLWPLSVDGILVLSTAGLLQARGRSGHRAITMVWLAFAVGIAVSLAANIAAAPTFGWRPVLVTGWPPVALLLAVELLAHSPHRDTTDTHSETAIETNTETGEMPTESHLALVAEPSRATAKQIMWARYRQQRSQGRMPTGAELDRVANTNNYGRAVLRELREWEQTGRDETEP